MEDTVGNRFAPTDEELVGYYLMSKAKGEPIFCPIPDCDIYGSEEPWKIFDKQSKEKFYVFTKLKMKSKSVVQRTAGSGTWLSRNCVPITDQRGTLLGFNRYFVFKPKNDDRVNGHWIMHEFSLPGEVPSNGYVICQIRNADKDPKKKSKRESQGDGYEAAPVRRKLEPVVTSMAPSQQPVEFQQEIGNQLIETDQPVETSVWPFLELQQEIGNQLIETDQPVETSVWPSLELQQEIGNQLIETDQPVETSVWPSLELQQEIGNQLIETDQPVETSAWPFLELQQEIGNQLIETDQPVETSVWPFLELQQEIGNQLIETDQPVETSVWPSLELQQEIGNQLIETDQPIETSVWPFLELQQEIGNQLIETDQPVETSVLPSQELQPEMLNQENAESPWTDTLMTFRFDPCTAAAIDAVFSRMQAKLGLIPDDENLCLFGQ